MSSGATEAPTPDPDAPIVIGALGGSGTRVVGEILIRSGVHLGSNLNTANDSVTATVLFNRPMWAATSSPEEIAAAFRRLRRLLLRDEVTIGDHIELVKAALRPGHTEGARRRLRYARRVHRERGPGQAQRWGWKEPNSHLFLPALDDVFSKLRFVYLARHPLDMAFSGNLNQLRNWGWRHGVGATGDAAADARAQLDVWIGASTDVLGDGRDRLGERLLFVRFEDLIARPRDEIARLRRFVDLPVDQAELDQLADLPRTPSSHRRHLDEDRSIFRPEQLDAARDLWGPL